MARRLRNEWKPKNKDLRTRILAVDDKFHIRLLLKEALPKKSYLVHMAGSGKEALELLSNEPIDIALGDINMPVMSGLGLTSHIHSEYPRVEVILMTGRPDGYDPIGGSKMGTVDILLKPIARDRLLSSVELSKKAAKTRPDARMPTPSRGGSMTVVLAEGLDGKNQTSSGIVTGNERQEDPPQVPDAQPSVPEDLSASLSDPQAAQEPLRQKPRMATAPTRSKIQHPEQFDPDDTSQLNRLPERMIAGYKVIKPMAVSDFGIVFLVEKRQGDNWQRYGMKVISFDPKDPRTPSKVEHLLTEAETVGKINHLNIVKPVEVGIDEGTMAPFVVHSFVEGCPLSVMIHEKMLDFYLGVRLLAQTASALAAMHARGLCHRTLKPENIILDNQAHVQLLDLGFASIPISNLDVQSILHRLAYHALETLTEGRVVPESDIYSLAVVAYSIVMGNNPFEYESPDSVTHAIHNVVPAPLAEGISRFPQRLSDVISSSLLKDPHRRPTSAIMASALQSIVDGMEPRTDLRLPAYRGKEP